MQRMQAYACIYVSEWLCLYMSLLQRTSNMVVGVHVRYNFGSVLLLCVLLLHTRECVCVLV